MSEEEFNAAKRNFLVGGAVAASAATIIGASSTSFAQSKTSKNSLGNSDVVTDYLGSIPVSEAKSYGEFIDSIINSQIESENSLESSLKNPKFAEIISNPIDRKSKTLLSDYDEGNDLHYNPYMIERNFRTISEKIKYLIDLRSNADGIENEIQEGALAIYKDQSDKVILKALNEVRALFDGRVSGEMINPTYTNGQISGDTGDTEYFSLMRRISETQIKHLTSIIASRVSFQYGRKGATDPFERYLHISSNFDQEIIEVFKLSRALNVGITRVFIEHLETEAIRSGYESKIKIPEPNDDEGYLDKIIDWHRRAVDAFRRFDEGRSVSKIAIYLGDQSGNMDAKEIPVMSVAPPGKPDESFATTLNRDNKVTFNIPSRTEDRKKFDSIVCDLKNPRIMAVQVRLHDTTLGDVTRKGHSQLLLELPTDVFQETKKGDARQVWPVASPTSGPPKIAIGHAPDTDQNSADYHGGNQIRYHRLDGDWKLYVKRFRVEHDTQQYVNAELTLIVSHEN